MATPQITPLKFGLKQISANVSERTLPESAGIR
jgi:hypothetical protein